MLQKWYPHADITNCFLTLDCCAKQSTMLGIRRQSEKLFRDLIDGIVCTEEKVGAPREAEMPGE